MNILRRSTRLLRPLQTAAAQFEKALHTSTPAAGPQWGGYLSTGSNTLDEHEPRFLITGASGQIGCELVPYLRELYGSASVIASDVRAKRSLLEGGPFVYCDVTDRDNLARIILENGINHIVHLATLLSAVGEKNPQLALRVNTAGVQNVLELAAQQQIQVYAPSTIAVFGPTTPRFMTPDTTVMRPKTMYGITKVHQELLGEYYHDKFGVDYRSLRYPGVISAKAMPGGGTTDYAVEIFHAALKKGRYECFLAADTPLPFLHMPDCLRATHQLMVAPKETLKQTTYNVTAITFTPAELTEAIRKHIPTFETHYHPDFRQEIAKTWPVSIDDSHARIDWGWQHDYDLDALTADMLESLARQFEAAGSPLAVRDIITPTAAVMQ